MLPVIGAFQPKKKARVQFRCARTQKLFSSPVPVESERFIFSSRADQADSACRKKGGSRKRWQAVFAVLFFDSKNSLAKKKKKLTSFFVLPLLLPPPSKLAPHPPIPPNLALAAVAFDDAASTYGRGVQLGKGEIVFSLFKHGRDAGDAGGADDGHAAGAASPAARPRRRRQQQQRHRRERRRQQRRRQQHRPVFAALLARGALERELDHQESKRMEARRWRWRRR